MSSKETDFVCSVASEIRRYLQRYPHAADTVEGVINWWLENRQVKDDKALVQRALDMLVEQDVLTKTENYNGSVVYKNSTENDT